MGFKVRRFPESTDEETYDDCLRTLARMPEIFPVSFAEEHVIGTLKLVKRPHVWSAWIYADRLREAGYHRTMLIVARWLMAVPTGRRGRRRLEGQRARLHVLRAVKQLVRAEESPYAEVWRNPPWKESR
jgi:hypothetical protein